VQNKPALTNDELVTLSSSSPTLQIHVVRPAIHCIYLLPFELKIDTAINSLLPWENVHANFGFSAPSCFRVRSMCGTDRRTDGQDPYCGLL